MTRRLPKVLVAVQDPGAANVVAPLVARLLSDGKTVLSVICLRFARDVFHRSCLPAKGLSDYGLRKVSAYAAERILAMESPDMVLVGTSEDLQSLDRLLTVKAEALGIPVVSVLDYWCNYSQRFSGVSPEERFLYLPDIIFLMDEQAREDMLAERFPAERLFVTGHPYLEGFLAQARPLQEEERAGFRRSLGVPDDCCLITFASETFGWHHDSSYRFPLLSGSRERTVVVLEHLLKVLSEIVQEEDFRPFLLNKLHPKNKFDQFDWIKDLDLPFRVRSVMRVDNNALIQSSSLVVGMTSMFLIEASMLGVPILPIVPKEIEERMLGGGIHSRLIARTPSDLGVLLRSLLKDGRLNGPPTGKRREIVSYRGATTHAASKLYEVLGLSNGIPLKQ